MMPCTTRRPECTTRRSDAPPGACSTIPYLWEVSFNAPPAPPAPPFPFRGHLRFRFKRSPVRWAYGPPKWCKWCIQPRTPTPWLSSPTGGWCTSGGLVVHGVVHCDSHETDRVKPSPGGCSRGGTASPVVRAPPVSTPTETATAKRIAGRTRGVTVLVNPTQTTRRHLNFSTRGGVFSGPANTSTTPTGGGGGHL